MKKLFLIVLGAFILSTSAMAWNLIPLSVNYDEEQPISHMTGGRFCDHFLSKLF